MNRIQFWKIYYPYLLTKHGGIIGRTRSGKTTYVYQFLNWIQNNYIPCRVVFLNTQGEKRFFKFPTFKNFKQFLTMLRKFNVLHYFPHSYFQELDEEYEQLVFQIFEFASNLNNSFITLIIDEVQTFSTKFKIPFWLKMLLTRGLGNNISLVWITQRMQNINNNFMSQSFWLHLFPFNKFDEPYLKYYGFPVDRLNFKIHPKGYGLNSYFFDFANLIEIT